MAYLGKHAVVTGGLGFIGSNLAIELVEQGANVTVIDSAVNGCGANPCNLDPIRDRVRVIERDIGEARYYSEVLARADVVFNLAGEISHLNSMHDPERDLELNTVSQLRFLNVLRRVRRGVRVVYAGTRQIYGAPKYLPVDEAHPIEPVDFNGVHKYAATMYHLMLTRSGDLDAAVLRLTNVYGPRMALDQPAQGFMSTFLRRRLAGEPIEVFGEGDQLRDPLYVDDAVDAFLRAGAAATLASPAYNLGGPEPLTLAAIAKAFGGDVRFRPFPSDLKRIDIGSYHADWSRANRELGWTPRVNLPQGIAAALEFYQ